MYRGVFVDDEDKVYARLMSSRGVLEFQHLDVSPIAEEAARIHEIDPMVVALDYRLDEVQNQAGADQAYKGSALAQHLRDIATADPGADMSVVLVSNERKIKQLYAPDKTAHDLFDKVYSKEEIAARPEDIRSELAALAAAYERLRACPQPYDPVDILSATEEEREDLAAQELLVAFGSAAAPHVVVRFVLRKLVERAGLLLDRDDVAARLGIASIAVEAVEDQMTDAGIRYTGILGAGWPRWWAHRLDAWTEELLGLRPLTLKARQRAEALSASLATELEPARSPWNGSDEELIITACTSCRRPTELRHSLAAYDPHVPRFSERRRICWDCIQTDAYLERDAPLLIDETDADLVADIKKRPR